MVVDERTNSDTQPTPPTPQTTPDDDDDNNEDSYEIFLKRPRTHEIIAWLKA